MLMCVFLVYCLLSLPKVWLKPTVAKSELATTIKEEQLRSKRQATFFDLLHQAIEKYANCADQHLAPFKTLTSYKQYETLVPEKYSQTNTQIVGASQSSPNKPNVKCAKVNLCITERNAFSETADDNNSATRLGKTFDTELNISKLLGYFSANGNYEAKQPLYVGKPYVFQNVPTKHSTIQYNNPYNQDFLSLFFKRPISARRRQLTKAAEPETVLGSALATKPGTTVDTKSCTCFNKTTTDARLPTSKPHPSREEINSCPCLQIITSQGQTDSTRIESDEVLGSAGGINVTPSELGEFNHNLNLLLMQLDEMAERASNGELRQILEKLRDLKSAFDTNFDNTKEHSSATTTAPFLVGAQVPNVYFNAPKHLNFSNLRVGLLNTMFKTNSAMKPVKSTTNHATAVAKNSSNKGNIVGSKANLKGTNLDINRDSQFLEEEIKHSYFESHAQKNSSELISKNVHEAVTETSLQGKTINGSVSAFESQNLAKSQDLKLITDKTQSIVSNMKNGNLAHSNDFIHPEPVESLTRSPITNKNSQILAHPRDETVTLESSLETENLEDYYEQSFFEMISESPMLTFKTSNKMSTFMPSKSTYPKQLKANHVPDRFPQIPAVSNKSKNIQTHFSESQTNSSKIGKTDSKITISITSDGNFKHIHMEQHVPDGEKLEINEKENLNMATPHSKGQFKDMVGTGSRIVNVVKRTPKNDSYTEPILLHIYPAQTKPPTQQPVSIYWHKIEKQLPRLQGTPKGVWQTFQSSNVFDSANDDDEENLAANKDATEIKGMSMI